MKSSEEDEMIRNLEVAGLSFQPRPNVRPLVGDDHKGSVIETYTISREGKMAVIPGGKDAAIN
ncbi:MAG TPA: hypothetical protein VFA52_02670 [Candidatus Paceibacterota bacterium]|nr:hypothetical protein [Candidatus Paceibacterota bacterium]